MRGYPTVFFFKNGARKEYGGPRTTEGIISWLDKNSAPVTTHITTGEQLEQFKSNENAVVGFFSEDDSRKFPIQKALNLLFYNIFYSSLTKNEKGLKIFSDAAESEKTEELRFGYVTSSALYGDNAEGTVELLKKGAKIAIPDEHLSDATKLADYLFDHSFPLVGEVGPDNFKRYVTRGKPLYLAFINVDQPTKGEQVEAFTKVASRFNDFSFGYISAEKFGGNMERMGASGKVVPTIVRLVFDQNKPIAFDREGQFNEESILEWVEGTISGKYKYAPKSEPVPEANGDAVKTIVGTTFDEIVHDESKDVLVEFYAPCKPKLYALNFSFLTPFTNFF